MIIEASLKCNIKFDDASHILKEYVIEYDFVKSHLLHIICDKYNTKEISLRDSIYYLEQFNSELPFDDEIISIIYSLSDGLYLAEQGIYGDM